MDRFQNAVQLPDWAVPCKHLVSVVYKLSEEIDNPFLVFELHLLDLIAELNKEGFSSIRNPLKFHCLLILF